MLNYLDGYGRNEVTLNSDENVNKGNTVTMTDSYTVGLAGDGSAFIGICTHREKNCASVLMKGFAELPFTGEAPAVGYCKLSANGAGGVKKDESGREILVAGVDTAAMTIGIIL